MCCSNPIIALPCSSPMCFAFEIAGSYSLQLHRQLKSHSLCQKASSTPCSLLSCSKARNSRAMYKFLPVSQLLLFSSPESGLHGDNDLTHEDTNSIIYIFQHLPHIPSRVIRQPSGESAGFPFGCMTLHGPEKAPSTTAAARLPSFLSCAF